MEDLSGGIVQIVLNLNEGKTFLSNDYIPKIALAIYTFTPMFEIFARCPQLLSQTR